MIKKTQKDVKICQLYNISELEAEEVPISNKLVRNDVLVGLEIETEGLFNFGASSYAGVSLFTSYWKYKEDGSLRNGGIEFILKKPRAGAYLEKAVITYNKMVEKLEYKPNHNWRTSLHVHVNMTDRTLLQAIAEITTYLIFEPIIVNYCGPVRKDNIFCVPFYNNDTLISMLKNFYSTGINNFKEDTKYSALNLGCLSTFGSMEYRSHKGTNNPEDIYKWLNIIFEIRSASERLLESGDLLDLPSMISSKGFLEFGRECFPETWKYLTENYSSTGAIKKDILKGVRVAQEVLFLS